MLQLRDADPWAEAASGDVIDMNPSEPSALDRFVSFLTSDANAGTTSAAPTATTPQVKVTMPPPKSPWYKTPIGIGALVLASVLGYRFYKKGKK